MTQDMHTKPIGKFKEKKRESLEWYDNIIMDFKQTGCEGVDWIQLTHYKNLPSTISFKIYNLHCEIS
jgi:hypothetical protein